MRERLRNDKYLAEVARIDSRIEELSHKEFMNIIQQCDTNITVEIEQQNAVLGWATKEWEKVKEPSADDIAVGMSRFSPEERRKIYVAAHGITKVVQEYKVERSDLRRMINLTREMQLMRAAFEESKMMRVKCGELFSLLTNW